MSDTKTEQPKKTSARQLTLKQRKFLKGKSLGLSDKQAALQAGYAPSVAATTGPNLTNTPVMREAFKQLLSKAGLTDAALARTLAQGIHATKRTYFPSLAKEGVIPREEAIDYSERRQYAELACRIKQVMPDKDAENQREGVQVVIQVLGTANVQTGSALAVTERNPSPEEPNVQITERVETKEEI